MQTWYAHTSDSDSSDARQPLEEHLENVANQAAEFASSFGYERWGYTLGLLHDIGKATSAFQKRLEGSSESVDHATPGARIALECYDITEEIEGRILAYAIAGHHGGMPNGTVHEGSERAPLQERLSRDSNQRVDTIQLVKNLTDMGLAIPDQCELEPLNIEGRYNTLLKEGRSKKQLASQVVFSLSVLCRMLYSCLVDADYLDTEQFVTPQIAKSRLASKYDTIETLSARFDSYVARLVAQASDTPVNRARASILNDCRDAASHKKDLFTLTVPTGGGKTLSVMAFSLRHALIHGCSRIIYASPFTTITEQTAQVFRAIFGQENVLEHHSNFDSSQLDDDESLHHRLAIQNWDAPLIVTTNVQLLESLYSNKPSSCRKLHNIANSILIFDEAQTLPDELLTATLAMLEELSLDYGVSSVLCTATQPALEGRWPFGSETKEIVRHREEFTEAFGHRTRFVYLDAITEDKLAQDIASQNQALCIVGTKTKARNLYEAVKCSAGCEESSSCETLRTFGIYHLSAHMTPLHRSELLDEIRERLHEGKRCLVISTQLIEAGVDVDFPNVYRELAGLDSLFQAAGRCNREGRRPEGIVRVFELSEDEPSDEASMQYGAANTRKTGPLAHTWLERMKSISRMLIRENNDYIDESLVKPFFSERYGFNPEALDTREIYQHLTDPQLIRSGYKTLRLETVARDYRIIDDSSRAVFVPWGQGGKNLMHQLKRVSETCGFSASMAAILQRSSVSVRADIYDALVREGAIDAESYAPISVLQLDMGYKIFYSDEIGLLEPGKEENRNLII